MVRFIVMIVVAILANLFASAPAAAQEVSRFQCNVDEDCGFLKVCRDGACAAKPCTDHEECPGGMCTSGTCVFVPCGAIERCLEPVAPPVKKPSKPWKPIREIVREEIQKIPLPTPLAPEKGDKGDTGATGSAGRNGIDGADGKDGTDRPLNAEVGMVTGLRQIGATPVFNLGVDIKLVFRDLWYLKLGWQFGTALVDFDDRQYQSLAHAALGLRLDAFAAQLGLDLGLRAEYSQTGTKPFGGWDRRSWTAGLELEAYPLVWAGVSDKWKRFLKIGAYMGLGEEFQPGSTGSDPVLSTLLYAGFNAVF